MTTSASTFGAGAPVPATDAPAPRAVVAAARTLALGLGLFSYVAFLLGACPDPPVRQMVAGAVAFGALAIALELKGRQESRRAGAPRPPRPPQTSAREGARIAGLLLVGGGYLSLLSWNPAFAFAGIVGGLLLYRRGTAAAPRDWEIPTVLVFGGLLAWGLRGGMDESRDTRVIAAIYPILEEEFPGLQYGTHTGGAWLRMRHVDPAVCDRLRARVRRLVGEAIPESRLGGILRDIRPARADLPSDVPPAPRPR